MKKKIMIVRFLLAGALTCGLLTSPAYGQAYREPPATRKVEMPDAEPVCPETIDGDWRKRQVIDGIKVERSPLCDPDNPYEVAAFVKGTNNISMGTLMETLLSPDAVIKKNDRDGDGDPDEIHIRLEVTELNGGSPEYPDPIPGYYIAPGVQPGFWVFAPKTRGMSTKSFIDIEANRLLRLPSPTIRVEQGDTIKVTLENTHYFPHTIHFHGVDHPYVKADGEGNDGVPQTSEQMVLPGESRTYEMTPRQTGTMGYHCHVQPHTHVLMGLVGMFVVEENRKDNWLQTFNVGAGHVRHPSVASRKDYDREYDMFYLEADHELHEIIQKANDPRLLARAMNREYDLTDATPDYFTLNGRSFPYTLRESLIVVKPNEDIKLRVFNASGSMLAPHTHGHKVKITHTDGIERPPGAQYYQDVFLLGPLTRTDIHMNTKNDGLHNYGEGIWLVHDHFEQGVTTDGIMPGGGVTSIVYESYLGEEGIPKVQGVDLTPYFTKEYYEKKLPIWGTSEDSSIISAIEGDEDESSSMQLSSLQWTGVAILMLFGIGVLMLSVFRNRQKSETSAA